MKPVKLEFKGLNSFSERAVIDFEPLLKSGIFGIFGETGSGKSTILDAINFALYGDIERNPDKLDKINPILLVDVDGKRARMASPLLRGVGCKQVYILQGGLNAWRRSGTPFSR